MKKSDKATKSALASLADVPQIHSDFGLGFAHNDALEIVKDLLSDIDREEFRSLYLSLHKVFQQWKSEHGKPLLNTLAGILGSQRDDSLSDDDRKQRIEKLMPWECHAYSRTPISLFNSLLAEKYRPLLDMLEDIGWHKLYKVEAILILDSHNSKGNYQRSDCISAALSLAKRRLHRDRELIKIMEPDARAAFYRRYKKKEKSEAATRETAERIKTAYNVCEKIKTETGREFNNVAVALTYNELYKPKKPISESTISRHLRGAGINRYKKELRG